MIKWVEKTRLWESLHPIFRVLFGLLFAWASWDKLMNPYAFAEVIYNYQILPSWMINPVAVILPWIEMGCGIFLVFGVLGEGSLLILNGLMVVFTLLLGISIYRGLDINCGCFSLAGEGEKVAWVTLARDFGLLLFGGLVFLGETHRIRRHLARQ